MWISKTVYEEFKQAKKRADYDVEMYKTLYEGAIQEALKYKRLYNDLREKAPLRLYEVEIYLKLLEPIVYKIETISPDEAQEIAVKMFKDNNKDIPTSNIVMITVNPICAK
jgi:hypothetical protein